jgi:hypothetical protein
MIWGRVGKMSACQAPIPSRYNGSTARKILEASERMDLEGAVKKHLEIIQQNGLIVMFPYNIFHKAWYEQFSLPLRQFQQTSTKFHIHIDITGPSLLGDFPYGGCLSSPRGGNKHNQAIV